MQTQTLCRVHVTLPETSDSFLVNAFAASDGRRDTEYAVVIAVDKPIPDAYIVGLLGSGFHVSGSTSLHDTLQKIALHSQTMWGDVSVALKEENSRKSSMPQRSMEKWNTETDKLHKTFLASVRRMDEATDCWEHVAALGRVSVLRTASRGVASPGKKRAHTGEFHAETMFAEDAISFPNKEEEEEEEGGGLGSHIYPQEGGSGCQKRKDPSKQTSRQTREMVVQKGLGILVARQQRGCTVHPQKMKELRDLLSCYKTETSTRLMMAHEMFMEGMVTTVHCNPCGIREMLGVYEKFMRAECGAIITRNDAGGHA